MKIVPALSSAFIIPIAFAIAASGFAAEPANRADTGQIDVLIEAPFDGTIPEGLEIRARMVSIDPAEPSIIKWRHGGEGLSGKSFSGVFLKKVAKSDQPDIDAVLDSPKGLKSPGRKKSTTPEVSNQLAVGEWSAWMPVSDFVLRKAPPRLFLTVTAGRRSQYIGAHPFGGRRFEGYSTGLEIEFEVRFKEKALKTFRSRAEHGSTVGAVIPFHHLAGGKPPNDPAFVEGIGSLLDYAKAREDFVRSLPYADAPMPEKFQMLTALNGYGEGAYHGIRYSSREVAETEGRTLRMLGINGFQGGPSFLHEQRIRGEGMGMAFARGINPGVPGYPVPRHTPGKDVPEAGCPYAPGVPARQEEAVAAALELAKSAKVDVFWGTTEDEIGTVIDRSPEGKSHLSVCPHCKAGFHEFLKGEGLTPTDFGESSWDALAPLDVWVKPPRDGDLSGWDHAWLRTKKDAMLAFWTRRFNCHASAQLFTPMRHAFERATVEAIDGSDSPRYYAGAMRGNTFLMKGHSLDFFNFYRLADNCFVYETSNRDPRIWQWDSYLCDVGRRVSTDLNKSFGILVKPHRGAPVQRALSAVGRGATMINWYTYGPDYAKGDSFSQDPDRLALVQKANAMIAGAEDILYDSEWVQEPEIAIIKPRAAEIWMGLTGNAPAWTAAWENAKWMHTALTHAQLPVDAIDSVMVRENDLSKYRVIYLNGPNFEEAAVEKLLAWVESGGTLVTTGWGLSRNETNEPLDIFREAAGLKSRAEPEMWARVPLYGATAVGDFTDEKNRIAEPPGNAAIRWTGSDLAHRVVVGWEKLDPADDAKILARWSDGSAAIVEKARGKGTIVTIGFFPGLEYAAGVLDASYDMTRFPAAMRTFAVVPAADRVAPTVSTDVPTVEGLLVRNRSTGKRAVLLMNWTYRIAGQRADGKAVREHVPMAGVTVRVRCEDPPSEVVSAIDGQRLAAEKTEGGFSVVLPLLEEGAILRLE